MRSVVLFTFFSQWSQGRKSYYSLISFSTYHLKWAIFSFLQRLFCLVAIYGNLTFLTSLNSLFTIFHGAFSVCNFVYHKRTFPQRSAMNFLPSRSGRVLPKVLTKLTLTMKYSKGLRGCMSSSEEEKPKAQHCLRGLHLGFIQHLTITNSVLKILKSKMHCFLLLDVIFL